MKDKMFREMVSQLTLEEKAGLTSGQNFWYTKAVERLKIPSVRISDGPHGLRTTEGDVGGLEECASSKAVCFPAACATAASFDRNVLYRMGEELGKECQALGVDIVLGPGVNIKRSPLCGRNFEYFSEDPLLAGELGAAFVQGVQGQGRGTSLKHFFANSQEYRRMDCSSEMDERTMREIYLSAFEIIVKKAQPWTVMASYNRIGGVYSTQNRQYIDGILRKEWGFKGLVTSDWGATHDRAAAVEAGCDLTMPAEETDKEIIRAIEEGKLAESDLDDCVARILELAWKAAETREDKVIFDFEGGHALAREIAEECMVLLKNDESLLPLDKEKKVAFIGYFAEKVRYQGGGSSHINSFRTVSALKAAKEAGVSVSFAVGCREDGSTSKELLEEAVKAAGEADAAVVFVGLTDAMESEGVDRRHMRLAKGHNTLVETVCRANPNTVVVLHNGSPVEMPWVEQPKAILEAYLAGQAAGKVTVDILFGDVNPSGHLPESFPKRLEDNPSYLFYFGERGKVTYQEGLFVGYRYYESKRQDVLFPFGHGLSYTTFQYSNLILNRKQINEDETLTASVTVTNTGNRAGKAVVQVYVSPAKVEMIRPVRELKEFSKVMLHPGESREVTFELGKRAFAHWNPTAHDWRCEAGEYMIQIGENAHDILLEQAVTMQADPIPPEGGYGVHVSIREFAKHNDGYDFLDKNIHYMVKDPSMTGFVPEGLLKEAEKMQGKVSLTVLNLLAKRVNSTEGEDGILEALLGLPISSVAYFLPEEENKVLTELFDKMNRQ